MVRPGHQLTFDRSLLLAASLHASAIAIASSALQHSDAWWLASLLNS
jgi:hypothetical protein